MKYQTKQLDIIGIIFTISIITSPSSHAGWNDINPFALGTNEGLFSLAGSANYMVYQTPGFASFSAGLMPQSFSNIINLPYNNQYTQYINSGVSQFFSGSGCSLGISYCNALNSANSTFSNNSPQVQGIANRCFQFHGYEACKQAGF